MNIFTDKRFWAFLLIGSGLILLANELLNLNLPLFTILFSLVLIIFGISLIFRNSNNKGEDSNSNSDSGFQFEFDSETGFEKNAIFSSRKADSKYEGLAGKYSAIFGSYFLQINAEQVKDQSIEVNAVFGECRIYLPKSVNLHINANAAFGNVSVPRHSSVSFGDENIFHKADPESDKTLRIKANAVFGNVQVEFY